MPDADAFRALARSSPWRWSTLRFTVRWRGEHALEPVRAWLRRPDALRVESLDGRFLQVVREQRQQVGVLTTDGGRTVSLPWPAEGPAPVLRPDGLVAERPDGLSYDDPMYQSYSWVALLDPVELADGRDHETGTLAGPALEVEAVRVVEHGGRPAWEALVRTTTRYEPRCACCPLLRDAEIDRLEYGERWEGAEYPSASLVRLDAGTGVCLWTEALDGSFAGDGHDVRIEDVDEPMDDTLFP
ncbi:hypothetical protein ACI78V_20120 [Geodermatophilus sp. SYSU D00742]